MLNTEKAPAADAPPFSPWRLCVAPMLDWTDKHCRHLHRLITRHARLYTEMVTCGALLHGSLRRHLRRDEMERPVALQLGGSDPAERASNGAMSKSTSTAAAPARACSAAHSARA